KQAVAAWVAAGDNLSALQKKLSEQFQVSMTYRDVRFLVDDLNLQLKDAAPKIDTSDVTKAQVASSPPPAAARNAGPEKKGFIEKAKEKLGLAEPEPAADEEDFADEDDAAPAAGVNVKVAVDTVT